MSHVGLVPNPIDIDFVYLPSNASSICMALRLTAPRQMKNNKHTAQLQFNSECKYNSLYRAHSTDIDTSLCGSNIREISEPVHNSYDRRIKK